MDNFYNQGEIIDLKTLYDYYLKQRKSSKLIKLPKNFYILSKNLIKKLNDDLKELSSLDHEDVNTYMSLLMKREKALVQAKKILENIFKLRINLILALANNVSDGNINIKVESLTPEEEDLFNELVNNLKNFRTKIIKKIMKGEDFVKDIEEESLEENMVLVAVKDYIPKFIYKDLKSYGPFEPEEVANLPEGAAKILESKKKVDFI